MKILPYSEDGYQLLHNGVIALSKMEATGMRVDVGFLEKSISTAKREVAEMRAALRKTKFWKAWRKKFGSRSNINSNPQLGKILFDVMGYDPPEKTKTGKYKTDETTLSKVDNSFVRKLLKIKKIQKSIQFLENIESEICHGKVHTSFALNMVRTFRSSSSSPNIQNIPVRNEEMKKRIRRCFVASKGRRLVEIDYSGAEVRVAACYHKDPRMEKYIRDPKSDMHRDMAMECYLLSRSEVNKKSRYCAKNKFVFPQFYGDWWLSCARHLWHAIDELSLETNTGVPMREHLASKGIRELGSASKDRKHRTRPGTFEYHIAKVEENFWKKRFKVYTRWKKKWYNKYLKRGWFLTKTGFICQGYMGKNDVLNYPIQGSAFHLLLWSLIQLVLVEVPKHKMRANLVAQIHDSIIADVPDEEVDDFIHLAQRVMTKDVVRHWPWVTIPLEIESEVTPVGGSWVDKKEYKP